jgi:negative regulator of sigma F NrsF-like protein
MSENREFHYEALIDRLSDELQPVKRLRPVRRSLGLWVLLEAVMLLLVSALMGRAGFAASIQGPDSPAIAVLILASVVAAGLALRGAIPGRDATRGELILLALAVLIGGVAVHFGAQTDAIPFAILNSAGRSSIPRVLGWATLPWMVLFIAVRRGVVLHPAKTGGLIGVAVFSFAIAADRFVSAWSGSPCPEAWVLILGLAFTTSSAWAGMAWLNPLRQWRDDTVSDRTQPSRSAWFNVQVLYPVALAASIVLLIFSLRTSRDNFAPVPDFDLAIESYEQSVTSFRPNVRSDSIDTVLAAYIEHGMPSYMWDFGPKGFKLVGGRLDHLPNGTPVSFTWFRKDKAGVMCMFRTTNGFNPPAALHDQRDRLLFYRYRGFSVCLINLGNYGNFISVIVSPMPMNEFERLVLESAR